MEAAMAGDQKNILILKGVSRYEVLRRVADELADALIAMDCHVTVIDTTIPGFDLSGIIGCDYDLCIIPQAFLFDLHLKDGTPLPAATSYPWLGWIFDDVLYHAGRVIENRFPNTSIISVDGSADRIIRDMDLRCNSIGTLLHGGFESHLPSDIKTIDILCPCTVGSEPVWRGASDDIAHTLSIEAIDLWKQDPELSAREALSAVCERYGEPMTSAMLINLSEAVLFVNDSIRYLCRKTILDALIDSGLQIHLIGQTQEGEAYPDHVLVHGPMDIAEVVDLIAQSRILINPFPTIYEKGAHERIFTAMINRAVCFTPGYPFLRELLGDRTDYIDLLDTDRMISDIRATLNSFDSMTLQARLNDNRTYALENHTWRHRASEIYDRYLL